MKKLSKPKLHHGAVGAAITVRVSPSTHESAIERVLPDGTLQVRLKAGGVSGQNNDALLAFLAGLLGVSVRQFDLVAGHDGADKLIAITGVDTASVQQRVLQAIKAG